jgi:hypothetical protein
MTFTRSLSSRSSFHLSAVACVTLALGAFACNSPPPSDSHPHLVAASASSPAPPNLARAEAKLVETAPAVVPVRTAVSNASNALATAAVAGTSASHHAVESSVQVKRFVVATGVQDREPLLSRDALPSDGTAIYAFAELANPVGASENVRITFERKGGAERVGDVTLPIPASTPRHRTWAFTRFIRTAGVWEAVLWSENGSELGRTSFEVKAS